MKKRRNVVSSTNIRHTISTSLVDIIIPVYNRSDLLAKCLESIASAADGIPYKVYVFDNGSSPQDRANMDLLARQYDVKITHSKTNLGFPKACNQAASLGFSPLLFFLNDDVVLYPGSLKKLVMTMDDPKIGVAGMLLIFPPDCDRNDRPAGKVQHVGLSTNIRAEVYHHLIGWSPDNPRVKRVTEVYAVTGAALMTRRKLWRDVGGFYLGYGGGTYEDVDYCLSVYKLGHKITVNTDAMGEHFAGATAISEKIQFPLDTNRHLFMQRWKNELYYSEWEIL